ncbi:ABC transporter ATP-binding protein [Clostridium sp. 'deep sea']|uniref:ABC transporter ATP-binding protein n=1 Tax=Clostridium sp. 'deep sea' TaxID=2779445 RepID=UPI00189688DB|nr:ABC transporter ATP-binding protein [Clostridium sp. 'deep sea']QOR35227.1 ABC transporter ATP-binding protein [Clostridium sp. 'deep sea']
MIINIKDLQFGYSKKVILNNISLRIRSGECVSILGPNGAGKSTLIKCIDGLLTPNKGSVVVHDKNIRFMNRRELSKLVSYVPQVSQNRFSLKVFDMVLIGRSPHMTWRSSFEDKEKAINALKLLGIENLAMRSFNELSGGQQQKVIIARAIAQETKILLLDEAISNLDIKHQLDVMEIVKQLASRYGISVVMVVHDLNIASRYSDKIVMMKKGEIVKVGDPHQVLTKNNIANVYGVDAYVGNIESKPHIVPLKVMCV